MLRTLARALKLPPEKFGLTPDDTTDPDIARQPAGAHKVGHVATPRWEEDDPVRRRAFLAAAGLAGSSLALPPAAATVDQAALLEDQLADVLLSDTIPVDPAPFTDLREALTTASSDFAACRYIPLAARLRALIASLDVTVGDHDRPELHALAAETYHLATKALIKLAPGASGLEWVSADRGMHAAAHAENPLVTAESQRLVASIA